MKRLRYLLPVMLQAFVLFAAGQPGANDSLLRIIQEDRRDPAEMKALNELAGNYLRTDLAKAKACLYRAIELSGNGNFPTQLGNAYSQMVAIHQNTGQTDSAIRYLSLLEKLSEKNPAARSVYVGTAGLFYRREKNLKAALPFMIEALDKAAAAAKGDPSVSNRTSLAGQNLNIGNTYIEMGDYRTALEYHLKALKLFEEVDNKKGISFCYQAIGGGFQGLHQLKPALVYTNRALALKTELNDERGIATSLKQIGSIFRYQPQNDSALYYYNKSLKIVQKMNLKLEEMDLDLDMGNVYKDKKDLDNARLYFQNGKLLAKTADDSMRASTFDAALISIQATEKKQQLAEKKLMSSLSNSIEAGNKTAELLNYQYLADHYARIGQWEKAQAYTRKYYEMTDSVEGIKVQLQLKKMEGQYNVEKKEQEIVLLKKDQQVTHLTLEKQKAFQYGAILVLALLLLICFLVINRYRIVHRARQAIEMEKMRNHIARDLHDDIGSTLTSINIMSNVALHSPETQEAVMRTNLQKIKDRSSAIMEKMDDIVWTINPQLLYRMTEFAAEMLEPLNIRYSFEQKGDFSSVKLDIGKRKDLYLLFKEAVNNAAKYSQCSNLYVRLWQDRDSLRLEIADDGKGFVEEGVRNGNGLNNMRERAASMVARIRIDSALGQGTCIGLDLPIT